MHNKDKVILDKKNPYEYNIAIIILGELCNEEIIDIFDIAEALIKLRKLYNLPVINIYGKKRQSFHHFDECLPKQKAPVPTSLKHEPCAN